MDESVSINYYQDYGLLVLGKGGYRVGRREKWPENVGRREKMKCYGCRKISMRRYYYGFF